MKMRRIFGPAFALVLAASTVQAAKPYPAPIQVIESEGARILGEFEAPGGLKGYAAQFQGDVLGIYLTPDGKHAIVGTLIDEKGQPAAQAELQKLVDESPSPVNWEALGQSTWIGEGDQNAKQIVYAFMDPNCPYCARFWKEVRPYLKQKGIQLRHIMVGVLSPTSMAISAKILAAPDPAKALAEHERAEAEGQKGLSAEGKIPDEMMRKVIANSRLMQESQIFGTPAIVYKDKDGNLKVVQGMPNEQLMKNIFSVAP